MALTPFPPTVASHEAAIDDLLRPLLGPAYKFAYMMIRDRATAEDVVQEAALKCWRKISSLRPDSDPLPWFLGFVANECRNARRSRWRLRVRLGVDKRLIAPDSGLANDPDLLRALGRLPHHERSIVLMFYYLDMPLDDIAAAIRSKPAAVRSRLYRAVKRLRGQLESGEGSHG